MGSPVQLLTRGGKQIMPDTGNSELGREENPVTAEIFLLDDNRQLSYAASGAVGDLPVFLFHGNPGCRFLPETDIAAARRQGIRLIVPERPGFGWSDFQPDRTLLDWPDDVAALADHLEIDRFAVLGLSAGGPYAAACAYKIPQRLTRAVLSGSLAPYDAFGVPANVPTLSEAEAYAADLAAKIENNRDGFYDEIVAAVHEQDRAALAMPEIRDWLLTAYKETFRNGTEGLVHELVLLFTRPWGFPLEAIKADVEIWHGDADTTFPGAKYLAERILNSRLHVLHGQGHFVPNLLEEIFSSFRA
jgi:pimeloyl-ACP methyl ester carboxylesterase